MSVEEKMKLIRELLSLNGEATIAKMQGNKELYIKTLNREKILARQLTNEGVFAFEFSSDEEFSKSLAIFCSKGCN